MRHFIVGDDATGIGIGKATLDHEAECKFPDKFLAGTVVRLLLQQAHEIFFWRGHVRNLAPTGGNLQRQAPAVPTANRARLATIADDIRAADNLVDELHQVMRLLMLQPMME